MKNRNKRIEATNKKIAEVQEKIDREKRAIACYLEIKDDPNAVSTNLRETLTKDAKRAEILIECHEEYLATISIDDTAQIIDSLKNRLPN